MVPCNGFTELDSPRPSTIRRIVVASDLISNLPSPRVTTSFAKFIADFAPDEIHGTCSHGPEEDGLQLFDTRTVAAIRSAGYGGPIRIQHNAIWSEQPRTPLLAGRKRQLADLDIAEIVGLHRFAPGWFVSCAAEAKAWAYPGLLAIRLARIHQAGAIVGGTRALGMIVDRASDRGGEPTAVGIEVGTLMAVNGQSPRSWQQGFVVLTLDQDAITASLVSIDRDGEFSFGGSTYSS
ncbi:MAG TPA: hypothetical protein DGG94_22060 [Micromonosporaceae bacterium]|nr:hypothetical protein [Micromonosporaceae bacterium]